MSHPITVPRLGWSMEEGVFCQWLKAPGEFVRAADMLFLLEGEKAATEIESLDSGYLCVPVDAPQPGTTVKVGEVIGFLLADGEPAPASVRGDVSASVPTVKPPPRATPRARRRARELGVDWTCLVGTGRNGRIRERDVLAGPNEASAHRLSSAGEMQPLTPGRHVITSKLRQTIARRMSAGVHQAVPVTLTTKIRAESLVAYREKLKADSKYELVPTYNDILMYWAAHTLREQPELNACWYRQGLHIYDAVHIAIAVDTPEGLLAPVVRDADRLTLHEIADRTRRLIAATRSGQLSQDQLTGGTFTISSLGMFGIDSFTPVLNLPQAAILGVGRIVEEPVVQNGQLAIGKTMTLSLTFDHRVVDGAPAARWLQRLGERLQSPEDPSAA